VVTDDVAFYIKCINAGVPQGSVLSSTLFFILIIDLLSLTEQVKYARNKMQQHADTYASNMYQKQKSLSDSHF